MASTALVHLQQSTLSDGIKERNSSLISLQPIQKIGRHIPDLILDIIVDLILDVIRWSANNDVAFSWGPYHIFRSKDHHLVVDAKQN